MNHHNILTHLQNEIHNIFFICFFICLYNFMTKQLLVIWAEKNSKQIISYFILLVQYIKRFGNYVPMTLHNVS